MKQVSLILSAVAISAIMFNSCGDSKNESNSKTNEKSVKNCDQSSHQAYVKRNFTDSGNDVYGISLIGQNGNCGYVYFLHGYNRGKGVGFDCTVSTNGENGIQITDPGCDYKFY
jgi:hypothetical protein